MSKLDIVVSVSRETGIIREDVDKIISSAILWIRNNVTIGKEVSLHEFGVFKTRVRPAKIARNLKGKGNKRKNPEPIHLPPTTVLQFKPSKKFFTAIPVAPQQLNIF